MKLERRQRDHATHPPRSSVPMAVAAGPPARRAREHLLGSGLPAPVESHATVERPDRDRVEDGARTADGREWEGPVREDGDHRMRHVGSVRADTTDEADDLASRPFAWHAHGVWRCSVDETHRNVTRALADGRADPPTVAGAESRTTEWSE